MLVVINSAKLRCYKFDDDASTTMSDGFRQAALCETSFALINPELRSKFAFPCVVLSEAEQNGGASSADEYNGGASSANKIDRLFLAFLTHDTIYEFVWNKWADTNYVKSVRVKQKHKLVLAAGQKDATVRFFTYDSASNRLAMAVDTSDSAMVLILSADMQVQHCLQIAPEPGDMAATALICLISRDQCLIFDENRGYLYACNLKGDKVVCRKMAEKINVRLWTTVRSSSAAETEKLGNSDYIDYKVLFYGEYTRTHPVTAVAGHLMEHTENAERSEKKHQEKKKEAGIFELTLPIRR